MADYNRNRGNDYAGNEHLWNQNKRNAGFDNDDYNRSSYGSGYGTTGRSSNYHGNWGNEYSDDWRNRESGGNRYGNSANFRGGYDNRGDYNSEYGRQDYRNMRNATYGEMYHGNVEDRERETNRAHGGRYAGSRRDEDYGYGGRNYGRYEDSDYNRDNRGDWWDKARNKVSSWFGSDDDDYRNREQRVGGEHRGKGPKGYHRSDDRIKEDVCDRLSEDVYVDASDVEVDVQDNEVVLKGKVYSREEKRRAEDLVESVSGVRHVENRLRVEQPTYSSGNTEGSTMETRRMMEDQRRKWW